MKPRNQPHRANSRPTCSRGDKSVSVLDNRQGRMRDLELHLAAGHARDAGLRHTEPPLRVEALPRPAPLAGVEHELQEAEPDRRDADHERHEARVRRIAGRDRHHDHEDGEHDEGHAGAPDIAHDAPIGWRGARAGLTFW